MILSSYSSDPKPSLTALADFLDQLYATGARNFLVIDVPPIQKSPGEPGSTSDLSCIHGITPGSLQGQILRRQIRILEYRIENDNRVFLVSTHRRHDTDILQPLNLFCIP